MPRNPKFVPEDMHLPCELSHDELAMVLNYRVEQGQSLPEALTTNTGNQVRTLYANAIRKIRQELMDEPETLELLREMFQMRELAPFERELQIKKEDAVWMQ